MPIYTDKVTYGQSNTPSENHFIDGSTPNVLSIKRGTPLAPGAEVLKVNAGVVSFPNQVQTWQTFVVGSTRVSGTTYTNTTGQTIHVTCSGTNSAAGFGFAFYVDGVLLCNPAGTTQGYSPCFTCPVPAGATYKCDIVNMTGTTWAELR